MQGMQSHLTAAVYKTSQRAARKIESGNGDSPNHRARRWARVKTGHGRLPAPPRLDAPAINLGPCSQDGRLDLGKKPHDPLLIKELLLAAGTQGRRGPKRRCDLLGRLVSYVIAGTIARHTTSSEDHRLSFVGRDPTST